MPVASHTAQTLAEFAIIELDTAADVLEWSSVSPRVSAAVDSVARTLGLLDVATATNMRTLETLTQLAIWRAARGSLAMMYDTSGDNQNRRASQMFDHAVLMVKEYEAQCARLGIGDAAEGGEVVFEEVGFNDPYEVRHRLTEY